MAIKINSNGQSVAAQRQVAQTSDSLSRVFERLSSGQRISRASDDAAGLAIADTLNAKSRVFTAGVRNLNDGISLLSVADSAVSSLTDITVRLKELAEQSANGVYSSKQRQALDNEAQALSKEFTRITQSTTFNGLNLFNGSVQGLRLQAGIGSEGSIFSTLGGDKGTGTFQTPVSFQVGNSISSIASGDLNNDGILDFVAPESPGNLFAYLGNGDGTFTQKAVIPAGGFSSSAILVDLNSDGILDILQSTSGVVQTILGKGDGTFYSAVTLQTGSYNNIASGDINNDGIADIFLNSSVSNVVSLFVGNRDGTYTQKASLVAASAVRSIISGDVNGDGINDVIALDAGGNVNIFTSTGDGTFSARSTVSSGPSAVSLGSSDLNQDGILDLFVSSASTGTVNILLGKGDGTFGARKSYQVGNSPFQVQSGDFNGDGIVDLISADQNDDTVSVLIGNGDGSYQARVSIGLGDSAATLIVGDVNGDGVQDFLTGDFGGGVSVAIGKRQDGVASLRNFSLKTRNDAVNSLSLFDTKLISLSAQRGTIGAFQSRIGTAINVLQSSTENFKAAESRIRDTDVAKDSAELTRLQILQRAGIAVLSQANLQPQIALKLLQS